MDDNRNVADGGMPLTKVNDNELHEGYSDRCYYHCRLFQQAELVYRN
jgi:hypothetical protein